MSGGGGKTVVTLLRGARLSPLPATPLPGWFSPRSLPWPIGPAYRTGSATAHRGGGFWQTAVADPFEAAVKDACLCAAADLEDSFQVMVEGLLRLKKSP
jgi:hypothetical protein